MTFWDETIVTARKHHWCEACGTKVQPKHRYKRVKGICDEGEFNSYALCLACDTAIKKWRRAGHDGHFFVHELIDHLRDDFGRMDPTVVALQRRISEARVLANAQQNGGDDE